MEIQNRVWGQGSEDALQTLVNLDSDMYRDAHDCLSQILFTQGLMWTLNRNVTPHDISVPKPFRTLLSSGWFIHGLYPKWKLLIKNRKKKKGKRKVGLGELGIKWGQVFLVKWELCHAEKLASVF